ncbi:MAG: class I SAM-dependent methyltransferase [Marinosulfonomonas sp.]|nr:class I SAM-dependent methyltransferase [Marinosulfonomonas sp.]
MSNTKPGLDAAYSLKTPQDSIDLYSNWAATYDEDFAQANDYCYPALIARIFAVRTQGNAPVLDVGAGTGLVGQGLAAQGIMQVDALDISSEMLAVAMAKGCYRAAITADLTGPLDIPDSTYGGFACAGTFTFGHVGAEAIDELIRIGCSGALYVLGINAGVYESAGFGEKFAQHSDVIHDFEILDTPVYGAGAPAEMQKARSSVAVFRKQ